MERSTVTIRFDQEKIDWYLANEDWWQPIISGEYQNYYEKMYGDRKEV